MTDKKKLLTVFLTFLKIGAFTFGGGYAMLALLENEFVENKKWLSKDEFLDMIAISESTPGPIAVNSATFIGYKLCGLPGAILATVGACLPAFIIIYVISLFFDKFMSLTLVSKAFKGIQACVVFLILSAKIKMLKGLKKNAFNMIIFGIVSALFIAFSIFAVKFSSVFFILICGFIGYIAYLAEKRKGGDEK